MANNEAKLKQNEDDLRRAQHEFVQDLEKANLVYSRNRWALTSCRLEGYGFVSDVTSYSSQYYCRGSLKMLLLMHHLA